MNISLYISAPGIQTAESTTGLTGTIGTENFNSLPLGGFPNGSSSYVSAANGRTYTTNDSVTIIAPNIYGGYGQGNYLSVNAVGSTATINFTSGINDFGFLWPAGDATNIISFFDTSDKFIASYSTGDLLAILPHNDTSKITALSGSEYYTGNYYGQRTATGPVATTAPDVNYANGTSPMENTDEPYGYLHFLGDSSSIGKVIIEKAPGSGDFESDNHSVSSNATIGSGASVVLVTSSIPELSSLSLLVLTGTGLLLFGRRKLARAS